MPFTTIHGIVPAGNYVAYVHLMTFFGGHQDEVCADQITLLGELVKKLK